MSKLVNYYKGLVRAFPFIVNITSIIYGFILRSPIAIYFGIYSYSCDIINHFIKNFFRNVIYKNVENIPLLGQGKRPEGAKYCSIFINEDNLSGDSTSFGMPSGHSNTAVLVSTFWILYILDNFKLDHIQLYQFVY